IVPAQPPTYTTPLSLHDALPISPIPKIQLPVQPLAHSLGSPTPETVYVSFSAEIIPHTTEALIALLSQQVNIGVKNVYLMLSTRSEEHTSELQSRFDLVCRPLLE